jgi:cation:H+ antiporter
MVGSAILFGVSLCVTLFAARTFARHLDEVGVHLGLPEAFIGLLTAMAADGPEIASSLTALAKGAGGVSLGVVVGSNLFNIAAMVGVSALLVGAVSLRREALALEGSVTVAASVIVGALVLGGISVVVAVVLLAGVLGPYAVLLVRGAEFAERAPLPRAVTSGLMLALSEHSDEPTGTPDPSSGIARTTPLFIGGSVVLIVAGSIGMVETALTMASAWHIPQSAVGFLILGPLTSIPNAATAVRLGLARRGSALVSDTFNSNTINLAAGVAIPGLFVSVLSTSASVVFDLLLLMGMTAIVIALLAQRRGIGRRGGGMLIAIYVVFVIVELLIG